MTELFKSLQKYNYWDSPPDDLGFLRSFYIEKLTNYLGNKLIKVLAGQRRAGKSFIMRQLISELLKSGIKPKNILYVNFEMADFHDISSWIILDELVKEYEAKNKPEGKMYFFFDEIQRVEKWEKLINSLSQDYKKEYEIFITGSNADLLTGELASLLSGRYISFEILPFSFSEYCSINNLKEGKESFNEYLAEGGLPEFVNLKTNATKLNYVQSLRDTIIVRDIIQRHNIRDVVFLENMFKYLSSNIGSLFSINNIVSYFLSNKITANYEKVMDYIGFLKNAYLIHEVERYDLRGKAILTGAKKYYLNDLSFRSYLVAGNHPGFGAILENAVFLHFHRLGYKIYTGASGNNEIDFIIESAGNKKYVQVAYVLSDDAVIKREFGNLEKIMDNYEKMVITLDDLSLGNINGIMHLQAWKLPE